MGDLVLMVEAAVLAWIGFRVIDRNDVVIGIEDLDETGAGKNEVRFDLSDVF